MTILFNQLNAEDQRKVRALFNIDVSSYSSLQLNVPRHIKDQQYNDLHQYISKLNKKYNPSLIGYTVGIYNTNKCNCRYTKDQYVYSYNKMTKDPKYAWIFTLEQAKEYKERWYKNKKRRERKHRQVFLSKCWYVLEVNSYPSSKPNKKKFLGFTKLNSYQFLENI